MTLSMTSIERKEEEGRRKENKKQNLRNAKMKLAHNTYIHSLTHTHRVICSTRCYCCYYVCVFYKLAFLTLLVAW